MDREPGRGWRCSRLFTWLVDSQFINRCSRGSLSARQCWQYFLKPKYRHNPCPSSGGFAVLAIDYRGYGRSSPALPDESALYADAQAAWKRMLVLAPRAKKRLIYGHSLGGAVAIDLALTAAHLDGLVVEGTYTSFSEVVQTTRYGWLPLSLILTRNTHPTRRSGIFGFQNFLYMVRRMR